MMIFSRLNGGVSEIDSLRDLMEFQIHNKTCLSKESIKMNRLWLSGSPVSHLMVSWRLLCGVWPHDTWVTCLLVSDSTTNCVFDVSLPAVWSGLVWAWIPKKFTSACPRLPLAHNNVWGPSILLQRLGGLLWCRVLVMITCLVAKLQAKVSKAKPYLGSFLLINR